MPRSFSIVMIGAGNVASQLAEALNQAGHHIKAVYSRKQERAEALASRLANAQATTTADFAAIAADVYIVSVTDQALPELLKNAAFPEGSLVVHTSGSQPLSVFDANPGIWGGVFYPLQTFSLAKQVDMQTVPLLLETARPDDMDVLRELAGSISSHVVEMDTPQRKVLHIAAVFACNFTNHLLGISFDLLQRSGLEPQLLHPLIRETIDKALTHPPFEVQTGPAARNDEDIIRQHLQALLSEPMYRQIYGLLTESIRRTAEEREE